MRYVGTVVRGIRTPIIKEDTNLAEVVVGFSLRLNCDTYLSNSSLLTSFPLTVNPF